MPSKALQDGVWGRASFSFSVDAQGRSVDIKVVKGLRDDVDAAILRNAHRLDAIQWQPGTQDGRPVKVSFTIPLSFNMPSNAKQPNRAVGDSLDVAASNKGGLPLPAWGPDHRIFPRERGVVYGSCIQRLGLESGGFGQSVRLVNLSTGKPVVIEVKPPFRSRKQNAFCYALPPGRYALHKYVYTASKWYGGEIHEENVRKAAGSVADGRLNATRYLFTVEPGKLHYLGTWNLEQENAPVFHNRKAQIDAQLTPIFKYLNFTDALVAVPE